MPTLYSFRDSQIRRDNLLTQECIPHFTNLAFIFRMTKSKQFLMLLDNSIRNPVKGQRGTWQACGTMTLCDKSLRFDLRAKS